MFERYTEQARRALFFARYEAFQRGSPEIGTEHLLLALFRDEQSVTARVFARGGLSLAEVQRQVDARTSQLAPLSESSEAPFSSDAKRVLHCAAQEADRLLHSRIGTEHLLLGLLREERCTGATILNGRGLRLATVRDQIVQMLSTTPALPIALPIGVPRASDAARLLRVSPSRRDRREGPLVVSSPHRVDANGFTLKELIAWAYHADVRDVYLPPGFDDRERHDAHLELPGAQSWSAIDRLVQDGVNRHFRITVARETRPIDVFVLTSADGPCPGRRAHDDDPGGGATMYAGFSTVALDAMSEPWGLDGPAWRDRLHSVGPINLTATTIADFALWLEEIVGRPVIDETGLTGTYDIELRGELQGLDELRQALLQRLALVLTKARREMPTLTVYRAS